MSRFVHEVRRPKGQFGVLEAREEDPDGYLGRVAKYIPGEIVALYFPLLKFIDSTAVSQAEILRLSVYAFCFLVFLVLTPVYFTKMAKPGEGMRAQRVVSTAAFVVWAYSLGGVFKALEIHNDLVAGVLLIVFSAVSGVIKPREQRS